MNNLPELISVSSSNVNAVGYDQQTNTLFVQFNDMSIYKYFDVPQSMYKSLLNASSVGKYLAQNIKGSYSYIKI